MSKHDELWDKLAYIPTEEPKGPSFLGTFIVLAIACLIFGAGVWVLISWMLGG